MVRLVGDVGRLKETDKLCITSIEVGNGEKKWSKDVDYYVRCIKNNETHGLLIGPHVSNLIAEIILTKVDEHIGKSDKAWKYTRYIDDYTCYVSSYDEAELFLADLQKNLQSYDLSLNSSKSVIKKLPSYESEDRFSIIKRAIVTILENGDKQKVQCPDGKEYIKLKYKVVKCFLELSISLSEKETTDIAVVTYAIKVLTNKKMYILSQSAKEYLYKTCLYLVGIYPYLWHVVYERVFDEIDEVDIKKKLSEAALCNARKTGNIESVYYALSAAIKYNYELDLDIDWVIDSNDCLLNLLSLLYAKNKNVERFLEKLKNKAEQLGGNVTDMERNWVFVYECLSEEELRNMGSYGINWSLLKQYGVSFIKKEYDC